MGVNVLKLSVEIVFYTFTAAVEAMLSVGGKEVISWQSYGAGGIQDRAPVRPPSGVGSVVDSIVDNRASLADILNVNLTRVVLHGCQCTFK